MTGKPEWYLERRASERCSFWRAVLARGLLRMTRIGPGGLEYSNCNSPGAQPALCLKLWDHLPSLEADTQGFLFSLINTLSPHPFLE